MQNAHISISDTPCCAPWGLTLTMRSLPRGERGSLVTSILCSLPDLRPEFSIISPFSLFDPSDGVFAPPSVSHSCPHRHPLVALRGSDVLSGGVLPRSTRKVASDPPTSLASRSIPHGTSVSMLSYYIQCRGFASDHQVPPSQAGSLCPSSKCFSNVFYTAQQVCPFRL